MKFKSTKSIFLTTLSFSAAIGLAAFPNESFAQRGDKGKKDSVREAPTYTDSIQNNDRYNNSNNRFYHETPTTSNNKKIVDSCLQKNIELIDSLANKMVWQARFDRFRGGSDRTLKAVSNHAELTDALVNASHGSCPIALSKAALAVDSNIRSMSERRTRRLQTSSSRSCGTVSDPILTLINESKVPSAKIVNRVASPGHINHRYQPTLAPAPVAARPHNTKTVIVKEVKPENILFALLKKHLN